MNTITRSIIAGMVGTAIMSAFMMLAPYLGMAEMSPPDMLAGTMGAPVIVGWIMHFMVGIVFAYVYLTMFAPNVSVGNVWVKGLLFGVAVFVLAQVMMMVMVAMGLMPAMEGPKAPLMIASLVGHIVFGIAVAVTAANVGVNTSITD